MYNKEFAKIYNTDWSGFSERLVDKILSLTNKRTSLLDLGCGTGNFLQKVENEFQNTVGIDISKDMIKVAKQNCKKTKFFVENVTKFSLKEKFDLVTCTYDMINHLSSLEDWQKMFCKVYEHLNKGGIFVFDFNTTHKMQKLNYSTKNISETENYKIEIENIKLDQSHVQMHFNIYNKSNKFLTEINEIESFYSEKEIIQSLKRAGFNNISFVDYNFNGIKDFNFSRIFVICKKS